MALRPRLSTGLLFRILFVRIITKSYEFSPYISVTPLTGLKPGSFILEPRSQISVPNLDFPLPRYRFEKQRDAHPYRLG